MALIIERDYKHGNGELFSAYRKEDGARQLPKLEGLTFTQVQAFTAHYFGRCQRSSNPNCPACNSDAN